jgi:outer membrane protein OmpA-like peptidoglycan-associated protein
MDGGLGANIRLSNYALIYTEVGVDRVQHNENWTSNGAITVGFMIEPGITQSDRTNIQIADNMPYRFEELGNQVREAETLNREYKKTLDTMNRTLVDANNMISKLRREIIKCEADKKDCEEGEKSNFPDIYFNKGTYQLTEMELDKLLSIAEIMSQNTNDNYVFYGYCSNEGSDDVNLKLAQDRCYKVIEILQKLGVESHKFLDVIPVGKNVTWGDGSGTINRFVRIVKK